MKNFFILITIFAFFSCDKVKEKAKETINASGEIVGKTSSEFIEGVTEGVDRTLDCTISISEELQEKGLAYGKFTIEKDINNQKDNKLVLYLIFNNDFNEKITLKVNDKKELENGRISLQINEKAGKTGFFDFIFDPRTNIETKSIITIE